MAEVKRKTKGTPDTIDKHVGRQLRNRRTLVGLSQEKLAESVGVTFQQIQKYERGTNRISASRLFSFSRILEVSIDYFYEGLESGSSKIVYGMADNDQEEFGGTPSAKGKSMPEDLMGRKETLDLVRIYYSVQDPKMRKDILKFVKSMVKNIA